MVATVCKDGLVTLYLDGTVKREDAVVSGVNIGSYIDYEDEEVQKKDYDTAFVGKGASLSGAEVSADGQVFVDEDGMIANVNITGGTLTGAPLCVNASGWYGAGVCLTSADYTPTGAGAVLLAGGTFSGCAVNPLNGYTGHGGAIETYGGSLEVADSLFAGNSANGTGAAGGAMALMYSTNTITGGTFSGNAAYFGGAIQQNAGSLTVTGALFLGNSAAGDPTDTYAPGGGAIEIHNGATASVSGGTFSGNSAYAGGAIYNDTYNATAASATIADSVFDANTADYQGGAIYNYASMTVSGSVFTGNKVVETETNSWTSFGGAIVNTKGGSLAVTGGTFSENSAVQGGAIATFIDYGSSDTANLTVADAAFSGNVSTYGGGIYIQTGVADSTVVSDSDFTGNTAGYGGGAICQCFGALTVTGGTFSANSAGNDGGAIAVWDSGATEASVTGAVFDANSALYGGAISHTWSSVGLAIGGCAFNGNGGETTVQGGAVWNDANSTGTVVITGSTFSGNAAQQGGAVYNDGNMRLENVTLATASDTVFNGGSLAFAGSNKLGAEVVNAGRITFSVSGADALVDDLGKFGGTGTYLVKLSGDAASAGAALAASAGTFSGSLSVKLGDTASADSFTLNGGVIGNDLAAVGDAVLRLKETDGALSVKQEALADLVPAVSKDGSLILWTDAEYAGQYLVEVAQGGSFDAAIRVETAGAGFDVAGRAGAYSCRVTEKESAFETAAASWTAADSSPRQVESNGNGRADIFFAAVDGNDVWTSSYQAKNTVTGETWKIAGMNRIRDTFTGSASDANILYLSDAANGDALFMDDIYSEFGEAARLSRIREVRAGAGGDIVDMTSDRYSAELAGMTVRGGAGDDVLWGASGGNSLFGDAGNDRISGGTGDDMIAGGAGDDELAGGGGNDVFAFGENWGCDVISQAAGGTVSLWFAQDSAQITASEAGGDSVFTDAAGISSVTVKGVALADLTVHYGNDGSEQFAGLAAAGAFLASSSEAVFETESARTNGVLASL